MLPDFLVQRFSTQPGWGRGFHIGNRFLGTEKSETDKEGPAVLLGSRGLVGHLKLLSKSSDGCSRNTKESSV